MQQISNFLNIKLLQIGEESFSVLFFLVNLLFPLLAVFFLSFLLKWIFSSIAAADERQSQDARSKKEKRGPVFRFINILTAIAIAVIVLRLLILLLSFRQMLAVFTTPFFTNDKMKFSFFTIILFIVLLYVANVCSKFTVRITKTYLMNYLKLKNKNTISMIIRYSVLTAIMFIGFPFIGIDIGSLAIILGALGFGIGFGLQDLIANFISGVTINASQIITEGDRIVILDIEGTVQQIRMLNTVVRNLTGDELIVPNRYIVSNPVHNYTYSDPFFYIHCSVSVSYSSDLHLVEKVMKKAAESLPYRVADQEIYFRVKAFMDSGIGLSVYVRISNVSDKYAATSDLHMKVWELFNEHGIEIPFPQLDLHLRSRVQNLEEKSIVPNAKTGKETAPQQML